MVVAQIIDGQVRVPVARLAAAQCAIEEAESDRKPILDMDIEETKGMRFPQRPPSQQYRNTDYPVTDRECRSSSPARCVLLMS
jgi:hypothetical protein